MSVRICTSVLLLVIILSLFSELAYAQIPPTIPPGCHPITAKEQAEFIAMGEPIPVSGMFCEKDKALLYGGCVESPYPYLQTKSDTGRTDSVSGLNSDFACRLYKFIKASEPDKKIRITSGYRSVELQAKLRKQYEADLAAGKNPAPVAKPGSSKHNYGLAVDLTFDGVWPNFKLGAGNTPRCIATLPSCKWAHENQIAYGLFYPMVVEPWHIEPSGNVNGRQQPVPQGGWQSDDSGIRYNNGGQLFNPGQWTPQMSPPNPSLFSPLGSTGTNQPTQTQPITNPTSLPSNYDGTPIPTGTSTTVGEYNPYSFATTATTKTSSSTKTSYEDLNTMTGSSDRGTSQSSPTSTSTSTRLNDDLRDIAKGSTNTGGTNYIDDEFAYGERIGSTSVALNPIHVTETFSRDSTTTVQTAQSSTTIAANKTLIVALLTSLRDLLLSFVKILKERPSYGFQGPWQMPAQTPGFRS